MHVVMEVHGRRVDDRFERGVVVGRGGSWERMIRLPPLLRWQESGV